MCLCVCVCVCVYVCVCVCVCVCLGGGGRLTLPSLSIDSLDDVPVTETVRGRFNLTSNARPMDDGRDSFRA